MSDGSVRPDAMTARAKLFETSIRLHAESLGELLDALGSHRTELADAFKGVPDADAAYLEHLEFQAADLNAWLVDMAELVMVATYHWLERQLKVMAAWLPGETVESTQALNALELVGLFRKAGLDLRKVEGYSELDLLRLFANSWKHNPRTASQDLLRAMGLEPRRSERGLLSSGRIELRLRRILAIAGTDVTCFDIARAMISRTQRFLLEVVRAVPFGG